MNELFLNSDELFEGFHQALAHQFAEKRQDLILERTGREAFTCAYHCNGLGHRRDASLIEMRENVQQVKLDREERMHDQNKENKELIRNLAHEIKNPLGHTRAVQLLELELPEQDISERRAKELREYTQVIIKEADRLQVLVDRLLAPNRLPQVIADVNIHEVCERAQFDFAEFPRGPSIKRDYDLSIPEFRGDQQQLIQVVLNIAHNAAQALIMRMAEGDAEIILRRGSCDK